MPKIQIDGKTVHLPYPSKGVGKEGKMKAVKKALKKKK